MHPTLVNHPSHPPTLAVDPASLSASPTTVNGSHSHSRSAQPGPSGSSGTGKNSAATTGKRRRSEGVSDAPDSATVGSKKDGQKKKKASRACVHCQKAHLTCDDCEAPRIFLVARSSFFFTPFWSHDTLARPCQRCIKRGIAETCTEGHRKRAKYLLDEEELEQLKRHKSGGTKAAPAPIQAPTPIPTSEPFPPNDPLFNVPFDQSFPFGSEAANLEYSILSAILGNPSPESQSTTSPPPNQSFTQDYSSSWTSDAMNPGPPLSGNSNGFVTSPTTLTSTTDMFDQEPQMGMPLPDGVSTAAVTNGAPSDFLGSSYSSTSQALARTSSPTLATAANGASQHMYAAQQQTQLSSQPLHPLAPRWPPSSTDSTYVFWPGPVANAGKSRSAAASALTNGTNTASALSGPKTAQEVYDNVTMPYDYTEGYHSLMKYLPYRPSLIALQMPLTEEDEVFVEKCFQRSIIELDKLISYSGTPTVVWRRTGEICLVGPEFCMLTEWTKEELLGKGKYIWELFENQSVVEYWENFATHAFENTTQSVYSHCILLKPSGVPVPATFCFSIRRDIFDLPSLVIGQWLPLL
ncbi:hypothetical protein EW146_g5291 [Bondarzewia mesenterica]|uniref:ERT1/acuK family PAS domain-containing protein n=1 Tax=Bondarzewia mesenterica TaxID=1095465 RepID=A0A4S4LRY6_9AGAM|nr:hypothetical protein EW146_g5291 [Bondarzewia mesenterica]